MRYADDFVVLARYQGSRLREWIESKLEDWPGLEINREKTRVVNLKEAGASPDFPGFTFRYYDDLRGRGWRLASADPGRVGFAGGFHHHRAGSNDRRDIQEHAR